MTPDILFQNGKARNLAMIKNIRGNGKFQISQRIAILQECPPEY